MELRERLKLIACNNFELRQEDDLDLIIDLMLKDIGNLDPELRDDLIYYTFTKLIGSRQIDDEKLKWLMIKILDKDHLFYLINEDDEDAVYTRTFSILIVACVLINHRETPIFTRNEVKNIFDKVIAYSKLEKDYRGYVEGYGWAHSTAHTADVLDELAMCKEVEVEDLMLLLEMIKLKVCIGNYVYVHKEDERLVTAFMSIIDRDLVGLEYIKQWLNSFEAVENSSNPMENYAMKLNIKNYLRSSYFRLLKEGVSSDLQNHIVKLLDEITY